MFKRIQIVIRIFNNQLRSQSARNQVTTRYPWAPMWLGFLLHWGKESFYLYRNSSMYSSTVGDLTQETDALWRVTRLTVNLWECARRDLLPTLLDLSAKESTLCRYLAGMRSISSNDTEFMLAFQYIFNAVDVAERPFASILKIAYLTNDLSLSQYNWYISKAVELDKDFTEGRLKSPIGKMGVYAMPARFMVPEARTPVGSAYLEWVEGAYGVKRTNGTDHQLKVYTDELVRKLDQITKDGTDEVFEIK